MMTNLSSVGLITLLFSFFRSSNGLPHQRNDQSTLIVGGEPAALGDVPYIIALYRRGVHGCGGSLVIVQDIQLIVTAAHCMVGRFNESELTIIAADVNLNTTTGQEQRRRVTRILAHEDYNADTYKNDIALLLIDQPFNINEYVQPIPLPLQNQETKGEVLMCGWGRMSFENEWRPHWLNKVQIPVVSDEDCARKYWELERKKVYPKLNICSGLLDVGGKEGCNGDSGGPVTSIHGGYLAGIVSWGVDCAHPDFPGVNTEVAAFIDWIENTVASL